MRRAKSGRGRRRSGQLALGPSPFAPRKIPSCLPLIRNRSTPDPFPSNTFDCAFDANSPFNGRPPIPTHPDAMWPEPAIVQKTQVADEPPSHCKFLEQNQNAKKESDALKHQRRQHDIQVAMLSAYRSNVGGRMGGWHLSGRSHPSDTEGGSGGCGLRCFFIGPGRIDPSSRSI